MGGFRSLADEEEVEFKAVKSDKGLEAVEVRGPSGDDCKGSNRRPGAKKKHKKVRLVEPKMALYSSNPTFLVAPSSENYSASSWKGNPKNLLGIHGVIWCYTAHTLIS